MGTALLRFYQRKHIRPDILLQAGLVEYKNGKYYDTFRNECMFPIMDLKEGLLHSAAELCTVKKVLPNI